MKKQKKKTKSDDLEHFKKQLEDIPAEEFQGRSDFKKASPEQRLRWLSQLSKFAYLARQNSKRE
ncbi:MAG: hypothetical protein A2504_09420 [Bdellovibrionales bacterium RIFOXYD12_FULL_39_22]|nr:MAG: hypothetical protein A2385_17130 [Bdellovibrionales bacterium RIFOXYB1_FULL_39_21]OFZ41041.1 MAG: hypothetical protein A2485_00055 [Bdellovibrionales bacterium RIFOXYC12_FULL_39_17]OFZ50254.1 MAG: hypothetical protein A2404_07370 [Bdellovibrionales bacterium RIFOXYC1_FULL_39_130]OFZ75055.1 MAG: hypothetical protein A2560_16065 [Bdellovibrionales bacterium RIFOXYD1_FULL_39_84]OFZ92303.1 MAG: hypothetical protein A2504_09420 [Bdellovibrionales bacterium RIFOXYD12_FULL_39_22]HLE10893.1 hy